jgi:Dolichyl-phosphate-mannose-protein mannosyltransferase
MSGAKKTETYLALILLVCLSIRLGYVLSLENHPPVLLCDGYVEIAQNILDGKGFAPTPLRHWFFRTPGYPLFVAAVWGLVPSSARFVALEVAQVGLSVATCGLLFVIANAVFGRGAALAGALLFALSPSCIMSCTWVMSETLQVFWIALATVLALRLYRSTRPLTAIGLGLVWGASGLTRPEATVLIPLLFLPVLVARYVGTPAKLRVCACAALGKIAIMAPWVARNWVVYGAFVLHMPLGGDNLFRGTYPNPPMYGRGWYGTGSNMIHVNQTSEYREITGPFWDSEFMAQAPKFVDTDVVVRNERDVLELDRRLSAAAWSNVRNHKMIQVYNAMYHLYGLWGRPAGWGGGIGPLKLAWFGSYVAFLAILLRGILFAWKSGRLGVIPLSWLILMVCHTAILLAFSAVPRYQLTVAIFLYIFAGLGLAAILPSPALGAPTMVDLSAVIGGGRTLDPATHRATSQLEIL